MCGCSSRATIWASWSNEVGVVGELRVHGLDRHLASYLRLDRSVDDAEGALPDLVEKSIAAERLTFELEVGVLSEDLIVQVLEIR